MHYRIGRRFLLRIGRDGFRLWCIYRTVHPIRDTWRNELAMAQRTLRLPEDLARQLDDTATQRGFRSASALIRHAIRAELRQGEAGVQHAEERIAASLDRMAQEIRALHTAQVATFALADALAKLFLTCVPEPSGDIVEQARSRARRRYEKFLISVAQGMAGDSRGALAELSRAGD